MKKLNIKKINMKKIACAGVMIFLLAIAFIYLNNIEKAQLISTEGQSYEKAVVTDITKDNLQEDGERYGNQEVTLKIKTGTLKGQEVEATSPSGSLFGADCTIGMKVIAIVSVSDGNSVVTVYSRDRSMTIYMFAITFAMIVCIIGGFKGCKAIMSLIFTGFCIIGLLFPIIYRGGSPIIASIAICILATVFTLYMIGGWSGMTWAAMIGTTCGVALAGISALLFGKVSGISGYNVSDIETLNFVAQYTPIKIGELLFSGIIISSLGAVMDVGMSISSTIREIHEKNPELDSRQLFLSGIHVGRDMMGTMTNTLILAYVGGSITTLVINYAYNLSMNQLLNSYIIGIEIMQGLSGSLGVVLTVPITALVASKLVYKDISLHKNIANND